MLTVDTLAITAAGEYASLSTEIKQAFSSDEQDRDSLIRRSIEDRFAELILNDLGSENSLYDSPPDNHSANVIMELLIAQANYIHMTNGRSGMPGVWCEILSGSDNGKLHAYSSNILKVHYETEEGRELIVSTRLSTLNNALIKACGPDCTQDTMGKLLEIIEYSANAQSPEYLLRFTLESQEETLYRKSLECFLISRNLFVNRSSAKVADYMLRFKHANELASEAFGLWISGVDTHGNYLIDFEPVGNPIMTPSGLYFTEVYILFGKPGTERSRAIGSIYITQEQYSELMHRQYYGP